MSATSYYAFLYRRLRRGFEIWLFSDEGGRPVQSVNVSADEKVGYPAKLELARAAARQDAFRRGIPYREEERPARRGPKPPPESDEVRDLRRLGALDGLAQRAAGTPGRAAEIWLRSAHGHVQHAAIYRPDRARVHARAALGRIKNAETCLARWREQLEAMQPVRRLRVVASPAAAPLREEG